MKTIFIVDDDEMLSMMLMDQLSARADCEIHTFSTGEECLQNVTLNPDIVVLDFNLNSVDPSAADGMEIMKKLRERYPQILIIMYSSQELRGAAVDPLGPGATHFVKKDQHAFSKIEALISHA